MLSRKPFTPDERTVMRPVTTLITLVVLLAPLPALAQSLGRTKQDAEVMNYQLSMDKLRKLVDVQRALNAAHAKNPQIFDLMDGDMQASSKKSGGSLTVAQKAAILNMRPEARKAFSSAGSNAREWLLTTEAMGNAYLSIEARNGTVEAPPPATPAQKANVALLEKNQAEFQRIMEELNQLTDELLEE